MNIEQIERIEERLLVTIAALGRSADEIRELCALARRGLERDDPILDGTDAAHPAWWRGHHHTALVFCRKVDDILDGKDNGGGANHEPWGALRRRLLAIAAPSSSAGEAEQQAGAICHCSCHNDPLYCHSCNECECHAPSPPSSAGETVCDYCDGSGFLNVLDEDGETVLDLCDAPAHDLEDAAPSGITSRCGNWPCTLKLGHSGPCSTSDPAEAATVVQTTPPEGFDEWYAEYGVGESTKDVARLAWNAAFRRTKHFAPATQETPAAGVTETRR
jgi:hypothetical protein